MDHPAGHKKSSGGVQVVYNMTVAVLALGGPAWPAFQRLSIEAVKLASLDAIPWRVSAISMVFLSESSMPRRRGDRHPTERTVGDRLGQIEAALVVAQDRATRSRFSCS